MASHRLEGDLGNSPVNGEYGNRRVPKTKKDPIHRDLGEHNHISDNALDESVIPWPESPKQTRLGSVHLPGDSRRTHVRRSRHLPLYDPKVEGRQVTRV
ncbi:hypothetical protein CRG98_024587 [Punica granatum]|uniref:Uncharacterized protein n=1 Tax=Punica granatum TaxID=22663 RepID=A0A2I0JFH8_PUNGR|nr:hypothetical protein CRG98_024587 [Punica granatum]